MLARKMYLFPTPETDGFKAVENMYLVLRSRARQGDVLDDEEIDYMDWANNILMEVD